MSLVTGAHEESETILYIKPVMLFTAVASKGELTLSSCFADGKAENQSGLVISRTRGQ